MPLIKPRTRGKQLVRHRTRLDRENNETLYAYAQCIGESTECLPRTRSSFGGESPTRTLTCPSSRIGCLVRGSDRGDTRPVLRLPSTRERRIRPPDTKSDRMI
jgi:hypothetical protein